MSGSSAAPSLDPAHARRILDTATEAFVATDARGDVIEWNHAAERLFGFPRDDAMGRSVTDLIVPPEMRVAHHRAVVDAIGSGRAMLGSGPIEWEAVHRNGSRVPVSVTHWSLGSGADATFYAFIRDLTEEHQQRSELEYRRERERTLAHDVYHDELTGLPNRRLLIDRLTQHYARRARRGGTIALLFVDLDKFKVINDSLGHEAGDELLRVVAHRLVTCVRAEDTVARISGDEFAVICAGADGDDPSAGVAERIMQTLAQPVEVDGHSIEVHASIGVAPADDDASDAALLLRHADAAMYRAKELGRGRVVVFDETMGQRLHSRLDMERDLTGCVRRGELRLRFRPVRSIADGSVMRMVAMAFWQRDAATLLAPVDYLLVAEEIGEIREIARWAMSEISAAMLRWRQLPGDRALPVGTAVAARHILQPGYLDSLRAALDFVGVQPGEVELGLNAETFADVHDFEGLVAATTELSEMGVHLGLTRFGLRFASMDVLGAMPVDSVTFAAESIVGLAESPRRDATIRGLVRLGRELGIRVIADGVDTVELWQTARDLGFDGARGDFVGEPVPPDEAVKLAQVVTG